MMQKSLTFSSDKADERPIKIINSILGNGKYLDCVKH